MIAGESLDESAGIPVVLHRKRGQLQTGNPAFRAVFQRGDLVGRESQAHHLIEEFGRLGWGEAQVRGA